MYSGIYARDGSCWKCIRRSRTRAHSRRPLAVASCMPDAAGRQTARRVNWRPPPPQSGPSCDRPSGRPATADRRKLYCFLDHAPHDRTCADNDLQLDADSARLWLRRRRESPPMLPQERQASLHDARGAAERQTKRLHSCLRKVPLPAGEHLCGTFSNLPYEDQAAV